MQPFSFVVTAIAAVVLIAIFLGQFGSFFLPPSQSIQSISNGITNARFFPQKTSVVNPLSVRIGESLNAANFSDSSIEVAFECNSASVCCDRGVACNDRAYWTQSEILFNKTETIPAFVRCLEAERFFACIVFFGKKPPQFELGPVSLASSFDLSESNRIPVPVSVRNSGDVTAFLGTVRLDLFRLDDSGRKLVHSKSVEIKDLEPDAVQSFDFGFELANPGSFEAEISVSGDKSGADKNVFAFRAFNQPVSDCTALVDAATEKGFDLDREMCREKFFCSGCVLASSCLDAWKAAVPNRLFEEGDFEFAQILTEPISGVCPET